MDGIDERRGSFSTGEQKDRGVTPEAKASLIDELKKRQNNAGRTDVIPEHAVGSKSPMPLPDRSKQSEHPEKSTSAVADESAALKPAETTSKTNVSGAAALKKKPSGTMDKGSANTNGGTATTKTRPPNLATSSRASQGPAKASSSKSSPNSPTVANKSRQSTSSHTTRPPRTSAASSTTSPGSKSKPRSPTRPVNLPSHITAPTASSAAKHETDRKEGPKTNAKGGHREATKPVAMPSRLTAGTASYNAKHEQESQASPKTTSSTRASLAGPGSKPRTSLAPSASSKRPSDTGSKEPAQSDKKLSAPPSEGFLARMMKPTTASSSKSAAEHEESKSKTPLRASGPSEKTAKPTSSKAASATAQPKKTARPSVGTMKKAEEKVVEKAGEAKQAVEKKLDPVKPTGKAEPAAAKTDDDTREVAKPKEAPKKEPSPSKSVDAKPSDPSMETGTAAPVVSSTTAEKPTPVTNKKTEPPSEKLDDAPKGDTNAVPTTSKQPTTPLTAAESSTSKPSTQTSATSTAHETATASEKTTANRATPTEPASDTALRTDGTSAAPMPLTENKDSDKAHVPAATTSDAAVVKPEIEEKIPPVPLTSQKGEEVDSGETAESKEPQEVKNEIAEASSKAEAPVPPSGAHEQASALLGSNLEDDADAQLAKNMSVGDVAKESGKVADEAEKDIESVPTAEQKAEEEDLLM